MDIFGATAGSQPGGAENLSSRLRRLAEKLRSHLTLGRPVGVGEG